MTNKEAIEEIKSMGLIIDAATSGTRRKSIYEALTLAIKALEERPIDDLSEYSDKLWKLAYERGKAEARPQGEWIKYIRCIECSVCKNKFFADDEDENCQDYEPCTDLRFNFCPNCGADMRRRQRMSIYEKTKCARALLYWAANNNGNEAYYLEDRMYAVADNGMVIILTADSYDEAIRKAGKRPQGEWIPISERLPHAEYGESDTVLVSACWKSDKDLKDKAIFVTEAYFDGSCFRRPTGEVYWNIKVVAWMPLPEPYKEAESD